MSPAQVLIRWQLQRQISVIPKSTNPNRLKENYNALKVKLSDAEMNEISMLDSHERIIDGSIFVAPEKGYTLESLWVE
jgi:alcohol dehydrogenase (NADP+)